MKSIEWCSFTVRFLDQTKLPQEEVYIETSDYKVIADGIRKLQIRGAPLIGIASAYAIALSAMNCAEPQLILFKEKLDEAFKLLANTRPTARNLFWALERMRNVMKNVNTIEEARQSLVHEAYRIHQEDIETCRSIGENGQSLIPHSASILTHCNTGALATGGEGTAQNIITTAYRQGKSIRVYVDETRPLLQGARLTAWELKKIGVDITLITDNMSASLMSQKKIDLVIVGADRIAFNGDVANKIGTYSLAVLANYHKIPFYVAAPMSTVDSGILSGEDIPIEFRNEKEVSELLGVQISPKGIKVHSAAFDITPNKLITAIVTEKGVHYPPYMFS